MKQQLNFLNLVMASALMLLASSVLAQQSFDRGVAAYKRGDYATALSVFRPLAEQGVPKAQAIIGLMYSYGEGVSVDYAEASKWYRKSADQGYAVAQYNLGVLYAEGKGVEQNNEEAVKWLTMAANGGHFRARSMLKQLDPVAHADLPEPQPAVGAPPSGNASAAGTDASAPSGSALPPPSVNAATDSEPRSVVMTKPKKSSAEPVASTPPIKVAASSAAATAPKTTHTKVNGVSSEKMTKRTGGKGKIYRVQLGSSPREDLIDKDWNSFQSRFPDLFSNLERHVERAEIGAEKAIWYRLQVGPFESVASARELCEQLEQRGAKTGCMPLRTSR